MFYIPRTSMKYRVSKQRKQAVTPRRWTEEETNILRRGREAKLTFDEIASLIPDRNAAGCKTKAWKLGMSKPQENNIASPEEPSEPVRTSPPPSATMPPDLRENTPMTALRIDWTPEQDERMLRLWFQNWEWKDIAELDGFPTRFPAQFKARKAFLEQSDDPVYLRVMEAFLKK
ncbi:hypothetical protein K491DRAFT_682745 [Lophiostoma macrostomum CBS 122681]|uniref:Myb-like domain-containing protein n=1 Tax=Lophiostoma macrostomum CBS 122681 TaxID=1314788 RepID=A0A6A6SSV7_9PLEO|nr:hypothetical protein K491DRAFT_682745 [Lophiostoma macrostomum CBS 122681]